MCELPPQATEELEVRSSMAEGSPPRKGGDTQSPLHAQEITSWFGSGLNVMLRS